MDITWEEPPKRGTGRGNTQGKKWSPNWEILRSLDGNPGKWAKVIEGNSFPGSSLYLLIKKYDLPYEVTVRKNEQGTYDVYARRKENSATEEE